MQCLLHLPVRKPGSRRCRKSAGVGRTLASWLSLSPSFVSRVPVQRYIGLDFMCRSLRDAIAFNECIGDYASAGAISAFVRSNDEAQGTCPSCQRNAGAVEVVLTLGVRVSILTGCCDVRPFTRISWARRLVRMAVLTTAYRAAAGDRILAASVSGDPTMHVHTIYRDPTNDYGVKLTGAK